MSFDRKAVLARIRARLDRTFPIGCRVRLSRLGRKRNLVYAKHLDRQGEVVGYSHGVSPSVLWDGQKTPKGYATEFLSRIRRR